MKHNDALFDLKNDPRQYEKEKFLDRINEIEFAIREFRKLHEKTSATDYLLRSKILKEIEYSNMTLSKIQVEYDMFKKYIMKTTPISK